MKFRTNVNIFGLGAGAEFEAEHTEFLQEHVDSGKVSMELPENGAGQPDGGNAPDSIPDAAESVSVSAKKAVKRRAK